MADSGLAERYRFAPDILAAVFFIGGRQRAIAGMLHMATHRAFMANHRVGSVIGAVFGGYPVLQSYTGYRVDAILRRDPVYAALPRLGGTLGGLDEIYRSLPPRRDQADTALVGVGA